MDTLVQTLIEVGATALGGLLVALAALAVRWLNTKIKDEKWIAVIDKLNDAVSTAVLSVQQTVVDGLKAANADGKLTDVEKAKVFGDALAQVKAILGVKGIEALRAALSAGTVTLEDFLKARIEAEVQAQKVAS